MKLIYSFAGPSPMVLPDREEVVKLNPFPVLDFFGFGADSSDERFSGDLGVRGTGVMCR